MRFRRLPVYAFTNRAASAFDAPVVGRPLIVVIDRAHLHDDVALRLLLEMAEQQHLHLLTLDPDDGFPTLKVGDYVESRDYYAVEYDSWSQGARITGVWGGAAWRRHAEDENREHGTDQATVLSCLLLMRASTVIGADAIISERPWILSPSWRGQLAQAGWRSAADVVAMSALLGRSRGSYVWRRPVANVTEHIPRHRYFVVASRQALPASWRFTNACDQHFGAVLEPMPISLAATALDRVAQVLAIRDELLVAHQRDVSDETAFDIRRHLDTLLWCWSAAFDAIARVAHLVYGLPANKLSTASWRKASWVGQLGDGRLAGLVASETAGRAVLDVSFPLRHTIHGEGLAAQTYMIYRGYAALMSSASANKRWDMVPEALQVAANHVHVPRSVYSTELAAPIEALGGAARWGVDAEPDAHVSIEPATFCERLMPHALATLNALMATIAVERLAGVSETELDADPPVGVPALQADQGARWSALLGLTTLEETACSDTDTR